MLKIHLTIILHLILSSLTYQMFRSKNFKNFLEKPYVGVFYFIYFSILFKQVFPCDFCEIFNNISCNTYKWLLLNVSLKWSSFNQINVEIVHDTQYPQKQSFADIIQNRCFPKFRKTPDLYDVFVLLDHFQNGGEEQDFSMKVNGFCIAALMSVVIISIIVINSLYHCK